MQVDLYDGPKTVVVVVVLLLVLDAVNITVVGSFKQLIFKIMLITD